MSNSLAVQNWVRPRILSNPGKPVFSNGQSFYEASADCDQMLLPWQRLAVNESQNVGADGKLLYPEFGLVVARQNGKGTILETLELGWLFVTQEELILHSAHEFKVAADHYKRMKWLIQANPEYHDQVKKFLSAHGQESIVMKDDRELRFIARTAGSGRGFPAKKVVLDEAFNLTDAEMSAIRPTLKAAPDPQLVYASSAVNQEQHINGHVLAGVRRRGIAQGEGLLYMEYSSPDGCEHTLSPTDLVPCSACLQDRSRYHQGNPSYPDLISDAAIEADRRSMSPKSFACEDLGIGDWPEPEGEGSVIDETTWNDLKDPTSKIVGARVFSWEVSDMGRVTSIAVAGRNRKGKYHVEVVASQPGTSWAPAKIAELQDKWGSLAWVFNPRSASAGLENDVIEEGVALRIALAPEPISSVIAAAGFANFVNAVKHQRTLRHLGQHSLDNAIKGAVTKLQGDGMVWNPRKTEVDITPLLAATNALQGFMMRTTGNLPITELVW